MWVSLLVAGVVVSGVNAVDWQPENWAFACDFRDNDLTNARIRGEDCGGRCSQTKGKRLSFLGLWHLSYPTSN
jgi:hypothetical protein